MSRTDTQLIPVPGLRPMPAQLSPRLHPRRSVRILRSVLIAVAIVVGAALIAFALPVIAFVVPQPVLVALIVVAVGYEIVRRARIATAGAR